jgi:hypothetical protein
MLRVILIAFIIGGASPAAWAEPIYLRCKYTYPANQPGGRYVVAVIDLASRIVELRDYHGGGTTSSNFVVEHVDESKIVAIPFPKARGDLWIEIDRLSGRITYRIDATEDADRLWNDEKKRIGGFDLSGGRRLILRATLDCQSTRRAVN